MSAQVTGATPARGSVLRSRVVVGVLVVVIAFGATAAGAGVRARSSAQGAEPASGASYLWSQDASGGSLRGPSDDELTLELRGLRPYVTRFTDHPARDAAIAANRDFYARWDERFKANPPNGVLTYRVEGEPQPVSIVLTLSDPKFDAKKGSVRYAAVRIRKQPDALPGTSTDLIPPVIDNPRSFGAASLFIDAGAAPAGLTVAVDAMPAGALVVFSVDGHAELVGTRTDQPNVFVQYKDPDVTVGTSEPQQGLANVRVDLSFCVPPGTSTTGVLVSGPVGASLRFFLGAGPPLVLKADPGGNVTGTLTVPPEYQVPDCPH